MSAPLEHYDGWSYYDKIDLSIPELILGGSDFSRGKQLMAIGMSFANLVDLMERNHEPLEFMKVHIRVADVNDHRTISLLIVPAELHDPKEVSFGTGDEEYTWEEKS